MSRRRVWQLIEAHRVTFPASGPDRREGPPRGHVAVLEPDRQWATALTTRWMESDGVVAIVPVIECGERVAPAIEITKSQEALSVLRLDERAPDLMSGAVPT